jgi:hypothetical protein
MGSGAAGRGERDEELLAAAGVALARGDWAAARDAYRQMLEGGEHAAVLEGLAFASWWLQDDTTTIDCRRRAFRLYLEADDRVSAARVAVSLAKDHVLRGEHSVANGWVGRARRLLAEAGPVAEAGWLGIVRAHIALYADRDPPQARRLVREAIAVGRAVGSRDVEMLGLAYEGLGLVSDGLADEGMRRLDESTTAAISGELSGVDEAGTNARVRQGRLDEAGVPALHPRPGVHRGAPGHQRPHRRAPRLQHLPEARLGGERRPRGRGRDRPPARPGLAAPPAAACAHGGSYVSARMPPGPAPG